MEHLFILLILSVTECKFPRLMNRKRSNCMAPVILLILMPLSFFFGGYLKDQVYSQTVNLLDELKVQITAVNADITKDIWQEVGCMQSYRCRSL
jgi:hypothetical protein